MSSSYRGTTMIELLVVIAVVSVLMSLLIPAVQSSREAARRAVCLNNLRQLGLAAHAYHAAQGEFPPGLDQKKVRWSPQYRGTSWFTFLLPHIEQNPVLSQWDFDAPLNNTLGGRQALSAKVLPLLICPSDRIKENPVAVAGRYFAMTSYGGNGGGRSYPPSLATIDGMFHTTGPASEPIPNQQPVRMAMVTDGTSQTLLLGERSHLDLNLESFAEAHWAESLTYLGRWAAIGGRKRIGDVTMSALAPINYRIPYDYRDREDAQPELTNVLDFATYEDHRKCAFGSDHLHGAHFALVDGSARLFHETIAHETLRALCTRAGQEIAVNLEGTKNKSRRPIGVTELPRNEK